MNKLLEKFNDFKNLNNYLFRYTIEDESIVCFKISQYNFPHLIGLQKLIDIPIINRFIDPNDKVISAKYIISLIKKEALLTDSSIRQSSYFNEIEERYNFLSKEALLSLSFTDIIIDFNKTLAFSNLKSTYLLTENKGQGILHLGLRWDGCIYTPETFFFRNDDKYIRGQNRLHIKKIEIFDDKSNLILEQNI